MSLRSLPRGPTLVAFLTLSARNRCVTIDIHLHGFISRTLVRSLISEFRVEIIAKLPLTAATVTAPRVHSREN